MNASYSFPPADDLLAKLAKIDYIKWMNIYMDTVEQICIVIAAICIIIARKWQEHKVTEKLQIISAFVIVALAIIFDYLKETVWPLMKQTARDVWQVCYTVTRPPLTM